MKVDPHGKTAITHYKVLSKINGLSYVELIPKTGRTHQLRVHMQALGCPIIGDRAYGDENDKRPLHLHARTIDVPGIRTKELIKVEAPLPEYFQTQLIMLTTTGA